MKCEATELIDVASFFKNEKIWLFFVITFNKITLNTLNL